MSLHYVYLCKTVSRDEFVLRKTERDDGREGTVFKGGRDSSSNPMMKNKNVK